MNSSTVSKVLRQREKYLVQDEDSRSPVKRAKGRSPDIERALAVWAKNQVSQHSRIDAHLTDSLSKEKRGLPLTDDLIRDKARAFVATTANPESHLALSSSWIEKFKLKNNLMGARSRKGSLLPSEADSGSVIASSSHFPNDASPTSAEGSGSPLSTDLRGSKSRENLKHETPPEAYIEWARHGSIASQHSAFQTEATQPSFSPGPLSPASPFYTPESGTAPGEFVPPLNTRVGLTQAQINASMYRPRSQTFPLLPQLDAYMAGASGSEIVTPKYITESAEGLDLPMAELSDPMVNMDDSVAPDDMTGSRAFSPVATMRPPPLPAHVADARRGSTPGTSTSSQQATSSDEARRAMEVVLSFFEQQPQGFLDMHESVAFREQLGDDGVDDGHDQVLVEVLIAEQLERPFDVELHLVRVGRGEKNGAEDGGQRGDDAASAFVLDGQRLGGGGRRLCGCERVVGEQRGSSRLQQRGEVDRVEELGVDVIREQSMEGGKGSCVVSSRSAIAQGSLVHDFCVEEKQEMRTPDHAIRDPEIRKAWTCRPAKDGAGATVRTKRPSPYFHNAAIIQCMISKSVSTRRGNEVCLTAASSIVSARRGPNPTAELPYDPRARAPPEIAVARDVGGPVSRSQLMQVDFHCYPMRS
nr:hypothetical protein CFP56_65221 [Quercus suber]